MGLLVYELNNQWVNWFMSWIVIVLIYELKNQGLDDLILDSSIN